MISKSKLWDRQGMQGGTAALTIGAMCPTVLPLHWWWCGVWQETSSLQCSFPLPTIKQSCGFLQEPPGCMKAATVTARMKIQGKICQRCIKVMLHPQVNNSLNTLHEPHLGEVFWVRFKIQSRNVCGFANCLWTSYTCSIQDLTFQSEAGAKWDILGKSWIERGRCIWDWECICANSRWQLSASYLLHFIRQPHLSSPSPAPLELNSISCSSDNWLICADNELFANCYNLAK